MKYAFHRSHNHFSLAGVSTSINVLDTDDYQFSFTVFGVDVLEFVEQINKCKQMHESNNQQQYSIILNERNTRDNLRIAYQGGYVSITRGNCKVLFHGSIGVIYGALPMMTIKEIKE